ncbi:hypothetical protein ACNKHS_15925 [Shigella flexneri]
MAGLQGAGKTPGSAGSANSARKAQEKGAGGVGGRISPGGNGTSWKRWPSRLAWTSSRPDVAQKPVDIVNAALKEAKLKFYDVLLVDTAVVCTLTKR